MGLFSWLFGGKKTQTDSKYEKQLSEAQAKIQELEQALVNAKSAGAGGETQLKEQKAKYEALLVEADAQIKKLDEQLANALDGKIDDSIKTQLTQIDSLKKKIKDLEDDLDEAQDDADDYKKKWKKCQDDAESLQEEVSKLNSTNTQLTSELETAKNELLVKKEELDIKMRSLSFVQEILTANETKDASLDKLYDKVDDVTDYVLNDFRDCVTSLFPKIDYWDYVFGWGLSYWNAVARKSWIQGKTTIAFVGEFSAGKTSIVNRVLSQDQPDVALLPTSAKATTAIPTYITGGPGVSYNFVSADNVLKTIREKTFKEVSKEILGQIDGISSLVKYFVMQYKNPFLDKISILDTPGFNSNDPRDAERTIEVINECDALFWVVDVNAGTVNRSSLKLIHENLQKPLYVVINQIDTKSTSEVEKVQKLIEKHFADEGIEVKGYVRFSKKEPLNVIMDAIKSVPQNTNDDYIHELEDWIPQLLSVYEKDVKEASSISNEKNKSAENIQNRFIQIARKTQDKCIEAQSIPHKTDRIFLDNIFKMSLQEGQRLINLLNQIADSEIVNLAGAFDDYFDAAQEVQKAYADLAGAKYNYQRVDECTSQLKKRIKEYKTVSGKV